MELSEDFIADLLFRAYRVGLVWGGTPDRVESVTAATVRKVAESSVRSRKTALLERAIFTELRRQLAPKKKETSVVDVPALEFLGNIDEPRRSFLALRYGGELSAADAATVLEVSPRAVSRLDKDAHDLAAPYVDAASPADTAEFVSRRFGAIPIPPSLRATAGAIEARLASPSHARVVRPAIFAVSLSLVVVLFLVGSTLSERMKRFPGYEKVAAILAAADQADARRAKPVSGTIGSLDDWLLVNHGIDPFTPPARLGGLEARSCRVFQSGNTQIIGVKLASPSDVFVYFFRGPDLAIEYPAKLPNVPIEGGDWKGILEQDAGGNCVLFATKGNVEDLKALVPRLVAN
jgi:hypothetical protein